MSDNAGLEAAIDTAGRDAVFARARSYGWSAQNPPPTYIWWQIIEELRQGTPAAIMATDAQPLHEQILGFRIW